MFGYAFANPIYFFLLIPAIIFFFLYILGIISKEAAFTFAQVELIKKAKPFTVRFDRIIPALLRLAFFTLAIIALARPQTTTGEDKKSKDVVDIVISMDISGSMGTLDFHPDNRLMAAKIEAKRFIEGRKDDRIGLVVFAGQSVTQCPLTFDHSAVLALLDKVRMGLLEDGTAIGLGLASAVNRLKDSQAKSKVVILLTDGVNNSGEIDPVTASDLAKQVGVRVYTIGVGKEGQSFLPIQDPRFGTRLLRVETEIDERMLESISKKTGGQYFRAQNEKALREIFTEIDKLEKTEIEVDHYTYHEEQYHHFLWPALLMLLIEMLWMNLFRVRIP